jgi:hypothetical protein
MLNRKTLKRINQRPKQLNLLPLLLIGTVSLALAALLLVLASSLLLVLIAIAAGTLGVLIDYRAQKAKMITTLTYGAFRGELMARYSDVREGCEAHSSSEAIWLLPSPKRGASQRAEKPGGGVSPPSARESARVALLATPGISTNLPIWGIEAGEHGTVFFFPEAVLLYRNGRYEGFSYESLQVSIDSAPSTREWRCPRTQR